MQNTERQKCEAVLRDYNFRYDPDTETWYLGDLEVRFLDLQLSGGAYWILIVGIYDIIPNMGAPELAYQLSRVCPNMQSQL